MSSALSSALRHPLAVSGLAAALLLSACGGGGGGSNKTPVAGTPPASTSDLDQQPRAPALTNNVATDGLNWINYRRAQVGLPTLVRNTNIDRAAQGHSDYQKANNKVTHDQVAGNPGFTGLHLIDRLNAAGYTFPGGEA